MFPFSVKAIQPFFPVRADDWDFDAILVGVLSDRLTYRLQWTLVRFRLLGSFGVDHLDGTGGGDYECGPNTCEYPYNEKKTHTTQTRANVPIME